jgi:hypothetical protein
MDKENRMTENNDNLENDGSEEQPNELDLLKQRADTMGIAYHPSIGLDKLKAKVQAKLDGEPDPSNQSDPEPMADPEGPEYGIEEAQTIDEAQAAAALNTFTPGVKETAAQHAAKRKQEATRLVRVRVTCMNPLKGNVKGEIIAVGNGKIGFLKKFVPFNAEQGWHIPNIILTHLKQKKFMSHYTVKDPRTGRDVKRNKLIPEFAIEIMPPLTEKQLTELKQRQLMAGGSVE